MSTARQNDYRESLKWLGGCTALAWLLVVIGAFLGGQPDPQQHSRFAEPVLPDFAEQRRTADMVRFSLADDDYALFRTANGWVMPEAGSYPARRDRIAELMSGFETLTFDARRTADPDKLDLLGLGDPLRGGNGVLVEFLTDNGTPIYSLILGRRDDQLYVRDPESDQAFRVSGSLPPFYNRRAWLDFDILSVSEDAIRSVRITDRSGDSVYLRRRPGEDPRSFRPAPPYQNARVRNRLSVSQTALAITGFSPTDAKPSGELENRPFARHITETFDGLEIDLRVYNEDDGYWVTLRAIEAGEGARRAQAINEKAEGWAFAIPTIDRRDFTPRVARLVTQPPPPEPDVALEAGEGDSVAPEDAALSPTPIVQNEAVVGP